MGVESFAADLLTMSKLKSTDAARSLNDQHNLSKAVQNSFAKLKLG